MQIPEYVVNKIVSFLDESSETRALLEGELSRAKHQKANAEKLLSELTKDEESTLLFVTNHGLDRVVEDKLESLRLERKQAEIDKQLEDKERLTKMAGLLTEELNKK